VRHFIEQQIAMAERSVFLRMGKLRIKEQYLMGASFHSPKNPLDGEDSRWNKWYASGLSTLLARCDRFVVVLDQGWDSSTWIGQEASLAFEQNLETFYWNPLQDFHGEFYSGSVQS